MLGFSSMAWLVALYKANQLAFLILKKLRNRGRRFFGTLLRSISLFSSLYGSSRGPLSSLGWRVKLFSRGTKVGHTEKTRFIGGRA